MQPFDKALKCGCFSNIKKFQGSLGKKWGHAKRVQKSDILTTRGFEWCRIGLIVDEIECQSWMAFPRTG